MNRWKNVSRNKSNVYFLFILFLLFGASNTRCSSGDDKARKEENTVSSLNAPTNVKCREGVNLITVEWDAVTNAETYNIYYNTTGSVTTSDYRMSTVIPQLTHIDLLCGKTYYYLVTAVNAQGESEPSLEVSATALAFQLPDTGQTQSYTEEFGEDSDHTTNPISFIFHNDGTLTDNNTGLTWYRAAQKGTWDEAVRYCETLSVGDYSDWRLPSAIELVYTADYGLSAYDEDYWSSDVNAFNPLFAWYVRLPRGSSTTQEKSVLSSIRCVRGGCEQANHGFFDNGDGTVTDFGTGLMWQQEFIVQDSFEPALNYCENLTFGGYGDWRLPNIKELASIIDYGRYWPAISSTFFPDTQTVAPYWSSTTDAASPYWAWYVRFDMGSIYTQYKLEWKYARCVRAIR